MWMQWGLMVFWEKKCRFALEFDKDLLYLQA